MTVVQTTTDEVPELTEYLARRHAMGLDTYDEWWEGVYRTVTGPTPEHGRLLVKLTILLDPHVEATGLQQAAPVNIGIDKFDCRVPDLGVYHPDTPRTSPAFLTTAELVVEVLSPGERAGAKMDFYRAHDVKEYLEIDLAGGTIQLYHPFGSWIPTDTSSVLPGLVVAETALLTPNGNLVIADFQID